MNNDNTNTENKIKNIVLSNYGEYKCLTDASISYRTRGNTRRLKFSKLYNQLIQYGVVATPEEVIGVIFKHRSNRSRVNVNN